MRRVVVISTDPALGVERRERLISRAAATLTAIANAAGQGGELHRAASGSDVVLAWAGSNDGDRLPDDDPRFAVFLTRSPYTTLGDSVTAARFMSEAGVSDSSLTELAAPFGALVRASATSPIDVITDVSGLSHLFVRQGKDYSAASNSPQVLSAIDPNGFDDEALQGFAIMGHFDSDRSGFADVMKIPAAHRARLQNGLLTVVRYSTEDMNPSGGSDQQLIKDGRSVALYLNNDSIAFDPQERLILDVIANPPAAVAKKVLTGNNKLYNLGFTLVENVHGCNGDHTPFQQAGFPAINTHQEGHGTHYHTANDTIELVSFPYAAKVGQLGLSIIATLAGTSAAAP